MAYELAHGESDDGELASANDDFVKNYVLALVVLLCASACVAAPAPTASPTIRVASSATPAPTVAATGTPTAQPVAYRAIPSIPARATVSPDGRWIVALTRQAGGSIFETIQLFTIDGTPTREFTDTGVFWGWLPDSSGFFVAPMVPQRAPPLAIVNLDGRVISTELQLSHQMLSRDATLIVAEHQEGCCVAIVQRELRVARRDGSGTRTLVVSTAPSEQTQSVALLGVDASDRVVYRDGTKIMRIPLTGGATTTLATSSEYTRVIPGSTSPDGTALIARGYDPARHFVIANDRVTAWDNSLGVVVENGSSGAVRFGDAALWVGPHTVLARDQAGLLSLVDAVTNARTPQAARLLNGDVVLAHQRATLLVLRGGVIVLLELSTGAVRETGLDLRPNSEGTHASALPGGGFFLSGSSASYRID
jgi:dipeptidyl aminopeptidase/acylaminoacyl peptidase